jgi:hypothetical protein
MIGIKYNCWHERLLRGFYSISFTVAALPELDFAFSSPSASLFMRIEKPECDFTLFTLL